MPGGKPVTAEPELTPKSPEMVEGPVLVTVVPAKTAKGVAVPRFTVVAAATLAAPTAAQMATAPSPSTAAYQRGGPPPPREAEQCGCEMDMCRLLERGSARTDLRISAARLTTNV